jgi:hypothetical protein
MPVFDHDVPARLWPRALADVFGDNYGRLNRVP